MQIRILSENLPIVQLRVVMKNEGKMDIDYPEKKVKRVC